MQSAPSWWWIIEKSGGRALPGDSMRICDSPPKAPQNPRIPGLFPGPHLTWLVLVLERNLPHVDSNCLARTQPLTFLVRVGELAGSAQWARIAAPPPHHISSCVPRPSPAPGAPCRAMQAPAPRPGVPPVVRKWGVLLLLCGLSLRQVRKLPLCTPEP